MGKKSRKDSSLDNKADLEVFETVTKDSWNEAIHLLEKLDAEKPKSTEFRESRILKQCHSANLKALKLCHAADIFCSESSTSIEILEELRLSLLENNFGVAARLLEWLSLSSTKLFSQIIWKNAAVLFLNIHNSQGSYEEFLEVCAGQRLPEDKQKLIDALVALPNTLEYRTRKSLLSNPVSNEVQDAVDWKNEDEF